MPYVFNLSVSSGILLKASLDNLPPVFFVEFQTFFLVYIFFYYRGRPVCIVSIQPSKDSL